MANIHFIRKYKLYNTECADVVYVKDGYISQCRTFEVDEMPKTAKKWLEGKTGKEQYDKLYGKEIIYK